MHPSSILSYYPSYAILDEIISYNNYDTINIYVDLKNNLQTLYMEHSIVNILESTLRSNMTDSSIFSSIMSFLAFHKLYSIKREKKINFFIFFESGTSFYHKNISKKYKISRRIDDLYGLDREKRELFFQICHKNFLLAERVCNKLPNINLIRLSHLEADFVPYYLISRNLVDNNNNNAHIVYSNDHDLLQCLDISKHVYIFQKANKIKRIVKKGEVFSSYLKSKIDYPDKFLPLAMAVIGDVGDDVDGVSNVGPKRFLNMLDSLNEITGGMKQLYDNVVNKKPIFDLSKYKNSNKYLNKVIESEQKSKLISNNLRLVSFEVLSRYLDDPDDVNIIKLRNQMIEILKDNGIASSESLKSALRKMNISFFEEDLDTIYYDI